MAAKSLETARMRLLARRKLDETGQSLRDSAARLRMTPQGGWIAAIREALGMTAADLGERLGISRAAVAKMEANERRRTIQLDTLQRAADALECDVFYALVPRKLLQDIVDEQRMRVFAALYARTQQHMRLEAQESLDADALEHLRREAEALVPDSLLWRKVT